LGRRLTPINADKTKAIGGALRVLARCGLMGRGSFLQISLVDLAAAVFHGCARALMAPEESVDFGHRTNEPIFSRIPFGLIGFAVD
jgi:hypothetical protein